MRTLKAFAISAAAAAVVGLASTAQAEPRTFEVDPSHTNILFTISHFGYSNMIGQFQELAGEFTFDKDAPETSQVSLTIQADSLDTDHEKRDEHLKGPDFLNAGEYPTITFESTDIEVTGESTGKLTGDLTMHGRTRPVTMDVTFNRMAPHPIPAYDGVLVAGFSARGTIERSEWGVSAYAPNISDEMKLIIEVEGHEKEASE